MVPRRNHGRRFIVFSPVLILLFGYDATWAMLGLCLLARLVTATATLRSRRSTGEIWEGSCL